MGALHDNNNDQNCSYPIKLGRESCLHSDHTGNHFSGYSNIVTKEEENI